MNRNIDKNEKRIWNKICQFKKIDKNEHGNENENFNTTTIAAQGIKTSISTTRKREI
jgi:hypothetical protein